MNGTETAERQEVAESNDKIAEDTPTIEQAEANGALQENSQEEEARVSTTTTATMSDIPKPTISSETLIEQEGNLKTTESVVVPSLLSEQDKAVFGNLNARLADAFTERIENAITEGVDSLPLLDGDCYRRKPSTKASPEEELNKTPKQRLWDALRYRDVRNVDVLEAYCAPHLLTLRKHPPARRKRIVAVVRGGIEALPPLAANDEIKQATDGEEGETDQPSSSRKYPTRSELPSENEQRELADELLQLQAQLEFAKQKRNSLLASIESAKRAEQAVADVVTTVETNIPTLEKGAIRSQVSEKAEKGNALGLLAEETKSLVGKLDGIKRDRNKEKDNQDGAFDFVQRDDPLFKASNRAGNKRHKPVTLEEAYRKDRRQLGLLTDSTNDNNGRNGLTALTALKSMAMGPSSSALSPCAPRTPSKN